MSKTKELFWTFFKIGAFTFGGGYAMVALLQNEFVEEKKWLTKEEFLDMVAIAESTPGPVAVNSATYIGYKIEGTAGAAASTVAVCLPSFAVIYLISLFFDQFLRLSVVASAFHGIQVCVIHLIARWTENAETTGTQRLQYCHPDHGCGSDGGLFHCSSVLLFHFYILFSGAAGLLVYAVQQLRKGEKKPHLCRTFSGISSRSVRCHSAAATG